ncbi:MAG: LEA type 2 family protein [Polyangiaceae bacterium]
MKRMSLLWSTVAIAGLSLSACSKPKPPTITPESVTITGITPQSLSILVKLQVTNPNDFALNIKWFSADVTVGTGVKMPTVKVNQAVSLPAKGTTPVSFPLTVPWATLAAVTALAVGNAQIPYTLDGMAGIGVVNDSLEFEVGSQWKGTIPRDMLMKAVGNLVPKIPGMPTIPGLQLPQRNTTFVRADAVQMERQATSPHRSTTR